VGTATLAAKPDPLSSRVVLVSDQAPTLTSGRVSATGTAVVVVVVEVEVVVTVVIGAFVGGPPVALGAAAVVSMEVDPLSVAAAGSAVAEVPDGSARSGTDGEHEPMTSANTRNTRPRPPILDLVNNSSK
jgi:hypothetical protein